MKKRALLILILFAFAAFTVACGGDEEENQENHTEADGDGEPGDGEPGDGEPGDGEPESNTIFDIAAGNPDFSLLAAAVDYAELDETLASEGPFTVFAPTDAAFTEFLDGAELTDFSPEEVADILLYHVLGAEVPAANVAFGAVTAANDALVLIAEDDDSITYGEATITATDIFADNGVIHVIDTIVTPPGNAVDVAAEAGFDLLIAAAVYAELDETLEEGGPFTIFAPTDAAFEAFLTAEEAELTDFTSEEVAAILLYHVVDGALTSYDVAPGDIPTLNGAGATIAADGGVLTYAGAEIIATDVIASNAVIHVIDAVVLPPEG